MRYVERMEAKNVQKMIFEGDIGERRRKETPTKTTLCGQHTEGCERDAWHRELEGGSQREGELE